jgi:hypothetical protein
MRAYSFLFTLNVPEIPFSLQKITTHLTTLSTHSIKKQPTKNYYPNYSSDSGNRIVFEKLHARANSQHNQEQTADDWTILSCHKTFNCKGDRDLTIAFQRWPLLLYSKDPKTCCQTQARIHLGAS